MKYSILASILLALSINSYAQSTLTMPNLSITIENDSNTVSPGGELRIKIQGDEASKNNKSTFTAKLKFNVDGVINKWIGSSGGTYYHNTENKHSPRYLKALVSDDIDNGLPMTVTMTLYHQDYKNIIFDTVTFYVIEGTSGHYPPNVLSGNYYTTIHPSSTQSSWYEIFCINSLSGYCSINIKDGDYDVGRYHGGARIYVKNHTCSDKGYAGTSRLDVGSSLVFDASKMIKKIENFTAPEYHKEVDIGACIISSNYPFFIRRVEPAKQKKSTPSL